MKHNSPGKVNRICLIAGLLAVLVMGLPYLLLGQDAIVIYHDQLDGELIAYLLQAKHLFQGNTLPEFMNGVSKTALIPPAPACVLFFLTGDGFAGLVCMQLLGSVCGYVGMYLLVKLFMGSLCGDKLEAGNTQKEPSATILSAIAAVVGILYAYLPFLPVYGLSQYGLPLLVWCLLQTKNGRFVKTAFVYSVVYALNSSLVLIGFGVLGSMLLWLIWLGWCNRRSEKAAYPKANKNADLLTFGEGSPRGKKYPFPLLGIWITMLFVYIWENIGLLMQTFGMGINEGEQSLSHKAEYVLKPVDFLSGFWQNLTKGGQHSEDYHYLFLAALIITVILAVWCKVGKKWIVTISVCFGGNVFFGLVAALWDSAIGIALRTRLSALGAFQMNRLLWIAPCFWYLALGCGLALAVELICTQKEKKRLAGGICCVLMTGALGVTGVKVLLESNLKPNIQKLRNPEYSTLSFADYYAVGVLEQVEAYLEETTGETQEAYRVVSLGIDPAAALYHGFYCLDGYSNNYPLSYKHSFREVIAPELAKSEYLRDGFDDWGNRCYLFSAECPGYYTIEKNGFFFSNYTLDVERLKALSGTDHTYLLSAAYIQNAEEQGLQLLREEPFETAESYYRIFLYGVESVKGENSF